MNPQFIPVIGDNFDSNYCNAAEKIGGNTQEKYDKFLKEEEYHPSFTDFYFYFNDIDLDDVNNTNQKKFYNPHTSLINPSQLKSDKQQFESTVKPQINPSIPSIAISQNPAKHLSNSGSAGSLYSKAMGSSFGSSTAGSSSSPASSFLK